MGPGGAAYHKSCLRCTSCGRTLDALNLFEHGHDPYCKMCHSKAFGTKGVGYGNAVVGEYAAVTSPTSATFVSPLSHSRTHSQDLKRRSGTASPLGATLGRLKLEDEKPQAALKTDPRLLQDDDFDAPSRPSASKPQFASDTHPSSSENVNVSRRLPTPHQTSVHTPEPASLHEDDEFEPAPLSSFPTFVIKSRGLSSHIAQPDPPVSKESRPTPSPPTWKAAKPRPVSSIARGPSLAPSFSARAFFDDKPALAPKPARSASVRVSGSVPARSWGTKPAGSPSVLDLGSHDGPKLCPRCSTTVYHAEQVLALGKKWHSCVSFLAAILYLNVFLGNVLKNCFLVN